MYCDILLLERNKELETFAKKLGFEKIYFKEDFKNLGLIISKDINENRQLIERKKIKIIVNPHVNNFKDHLHFRSSGLNHIICKLCNINDVAIGFSLDTLFDVKLLGRVKQNIKLCRKYNVKIKFFTFATNKYAMKGREDLLGFLRAIGFTGKEAKEALNY